MSAFLAALRWDVVLQARNGFYWASAFVVLVIGGLLLAVPDTVRSNEATLVPAILAINLQITTFFFVAGLMLLERDEGTLTALAVSPSVPAATSRRVLSPSRYWPLSKRSRCCGSHSTHPARGVSSWGPRRSG